MKILKIFMVAALVFCFASFAQAKTDIMLFFQGNHFMEATTTWEAGVNDFNIINAHTTAGAGIALYYTGGSKLFSFFSGIEVQYNNFMSWEGIFKWIPVEYRPKDTYTLEDESDGDTLEVMAYKNIAGYLTLGINLYRSTLFTLFVNGGGGVLYILDAPEGIYYSEYGIETVVEAPAKKIAPAAFGGAGVALGFVKFLSIFVNVRYTYIFSTNIFSGGETPDIQLSQKGISAIIGFMFRL